MTTNVSPTEPSAGNGPLQDFSNCHVGIIEHFERLRRLPELLARDPGAAEARQTAADMRRFFREAVLEHHADEEKELFPAVARSAAAGAEAARAATLIDRLVAEHRRFEALWQRIDGDLKRLARGKPAALDAAVVDELAQAYVAHARFEEQEFLPLAAKILSKNDQSALGLSLHMRHTPNKLPGYI